MVHRLQNRNAGYSDHSISTSSMNQPTLTATEGATALDINSVIEQNQTKQSDLVTSESVVESQINEPSSENISMESATYFQNVENYSSNENLKEDESNMETFEVDSIELATPELFSNNNGEDNSFNQDGNSSEPNIFDNTDSQDIKEENIKEPEMFEENNQEEDFEIPAFLRRQKN